MIFCWLQARLFVNGHRNCWNTVSMDYETWLSISSVISMWGVSQWLLSQSLLPCRKPGARLQRVSIRRGLRDLSEHLVSNLYVRSNSVAAFTVIAAMQETGNQATKSKY